MIFHCTFFFVWEFKNFMNIKLQPHQFFKIMCSMFKNKLISTSIPIYKDKHFCSFMFNFSNIWVIKSVLCKRGVKEHVSFFHFLILTAICVCHISSFLESLLIHPFKFSRIKALRFCFLHALICWIFTTQRIVKITIPSAIWYRMAPKNTT